MALTFRPSGGGDRVPRPNGAGKSTTLRMILGLDAASSGTATVGGRPYAAQPAPLKAVGALLDAGAVLPSRTAYHHLLALAAGNGISRGRVAAVLAEVGLDGVARLRTGTFSLGMRQRLGIAAALLGDPPWSGSAPGAVRETAGDAIHIRRVRPGSP